MMHLLQITNIPIKYEMEIQRARLEVQQDFLPEAKVSSRPAKLDIQTQNIRAQMDSYEMRRSLGLENATDFAKAAAGNGKESIKKSTRSYVDMGNQMSRINEGVTIAQIIGQKVFEQPVLYTAFMPSTGTEISWVPNQIETNYREGALEYDWQIMRNVLNYVPGSIRMTILQYPSVEIEYLGGPTYVPPSAGPDYVA
jgi:hypothetical protein